MEYNTSGFEKTLTSQKPHPNSEGYLNLSSLSQIPLPQRAKRRYNENYDTNNNQNESKRKYISYKRRSDQANINNGKNTENTEIKVDENLKSLKNQTRKEIT